MVLLIHVKSIPKSIQVTEVEKLIKNKTSQQWKMDIPMVYIKISPSSPWVQLIFICHEGKNIQYNVVYILDIPSELNEDNLVRK